MTFHRPLARDWLRRAEFVMSLVSFGGVGRYNNTELRILHPANSTKQGFGMERDEMLHTAQMLGGDLGPAKQMEISNAWIAWKGGDGR